VPTLPPEVGLICPDAALDPERMKRQNGANPGIPERGTVQGILGILPLHIRMLESGMEMGKRGEKDIIEK
jgi:hypothetical protein